MLDTDYYLIVIKRPSYSKSLDRNYFLRRINFIWVQKSGSVQIFFSFYLIFLFRKNVFGRSRKQVTVFEWFLSNHPKRENFILELVVSFKIIVLTIVIDPASVGINPRLSTVTLVLVTTSGQKLAAWFSAWLNFCFQLKQKNHPYLIQTSAVKIDQTFAQLLSNYKILRLKFCNSQLPKGSIFVFN